MFRTQGAARLREVVREKSQRVVADALGVYQSTVSLYARGRARPNVARALAMKELFGIPIELWAIADESPDEPTKADTRARGRLTPKQQQLVDFIVAYTAAHDRPPTMREMSEALGAKTLTTITNLLLRLQCAGIVTREPWKQRSVRVVARPTDAEGEVAS